MDSKRWFYIETVNPDSHREHIANYTIDGEISFDQQLDELQNT